MSDDDLGNGVSADDSSNDGYSGNDMGSSDSSNDGPSIGDNVTSDTTGDGESDDLGRRRLEKENDFAMTNPEPLIRMNHRGEPARFHNHHSADEAKMKGANRAAKKN
jgi:hypothetical protein